MQTALVAASPIEQWAQRRRRRRPFKRALTVGAFGVCQSTRCAVSPTSSSCTWTVPTFWRFSGLGRINARTEGVSEKSGDSRSLVCCSALHRGHTTSGAINETVEFASGESCTAFYYDRHGVSVRHSQPDVPWHSMELGRSYSEFGLVVLFSVHLREGIVERKMTGTLCTAVTA